MVHNYPIHQNPGDIYQNIDNDNYLHQNMVHTIYQTPEDVYQNVGNNNRAHQNVIYNHQNNFIGEQELK